MAPVPRTRTMELTATLSIELPPPLAIVRVSQPQPAVLSLAALSGLSAEGGNATIVLELKTSAWAYRSLSSSAAGGTLALPNRAVVYRWDCQALAAQLASAALLTPVRYPPLVTRGALPRRSLGISEGEERQLFSSGASVVCTDAEVRGRKYGASPLVPDPMAALFDDATFVSRAVITLGTLPGTVKITRDVAGSSAVAITVDVQASIATPPAQPFSYSYTPLVDGLLPFTYDYPNATLPDPPPYLPTHRALRDFVTFASALTVLSALLGRPAAVLASFRARCCISVALTAGYLHTTAEAAGLAGGLAAQLMPWEHPGSLGIGGGVLAAEAGVCLITLLIVGGSFVLQAGAAVFSALCEASPNPDRLAGKLLRDLWPQHGGTPTAVRMFRRGAMLVRFPFVSVFVWCVYVGPSMQSATSLLLLAVKETARLAELAGLTAFYSSNNNTDTGTDADDGDSAAAASARLQRFLNESASLSAAIDHTSLRPQVTWAIAAGLCTLGGLALLLRYTTTALAAECVTLEPPPNPFAMTDADLEGEILEDVGIHVERDEGATDDGANHGGANDTPPHVQESNGNDSEDDENASPVDRLRRAAAEAAATLLQAKADASFAETWRQLRWAYLVTRDRWINRPPPPRLNIDRSMSRRVVLPTEGPFGDHTGQRFHTGPAPPLDVLLEALDQVAKRRYLRVGDKARKRRHRREDAAEEVAPQRGPHASTPVASGIQRTTAPGDGGSINMPLLVLPTDDPARNNAQAAGLPSPGPPTGVTDGDDDDDLGDDTSESGSDASTVLGHIEPPAPHLHTRGFIHCCGGFLDGYSRTAPWALVVEALLTIVVAAACGSGVTDVIADGEVRMARFSPTVAESSLIAGWPFFNSSVGVARRAPPARSSSPNNRPPARGTRLLRPHSRSAAPVSPRRTRSRTTKR
jgi:hypothetical protein